MLLAPFSLPEGVRLHQIMTIILLQTSHQVQFNEVIPTPGLPDVPLQIATGHQTVVMGEVFPAGDLLKIGAGPATRSLPWFDEVKNPTDVLTTCIRGERARIASLQRLLLGVNLPKIQLVDRMNVIVSSEGDLVKSPASPVIALRLLTLRQPRVRQRLVR